MLIRVHNKEFKVSAAKNRAGCVRKCAARAAIRGRACYSAERKQIGPSMHFLSMISSLRTTSIYATSSRCATPHLSLHPCYLQLRAFGRIGTVIARFAATLKIIRCIGFYTHICDHSAQELTSRRLFWLCGAKFTMEVVLTDLDWDSAL
jgi:hypothetical protein